MNRRHKGECKTDGTDHKAHDLHPLISEPGRIWCRDCKVHFCDLCSGIYPQLSEEEEEEEER